MAQNNMFTHSKFLNVQARVVIPRLIFNLIPVMGILVLGWDVFAVIVLYWLDSALIIVFNALKMLFAQVDDTDRISGMFGSIFIYGWGWIFVGMAMASIFSAAETGSTDGMILYFAGSVSTLIHNSGWVFLGSLLSHIVSFIFFFLNTEFKNVSVDYLMFVPWGRLMMMFMAIMIGAGMVYFGDGETVTLIVLLVLKTAFEIILETIMNALRTSSKSKALGA
jgi:hypothetical protein